MNTKEKIEVMQAYEDGKPIEWKRPGFGDWMALTPSRNPNWNWSKETYRIKPEPATLLNRILADYGKYDVVELTFDKPCYDGLSMLSDPNGESKVSHVIYQSMKGFEGYVYEALQCGFYKSIRPVDTIQGKIRHPVGVLFTK